MVDSIDSDDEYFLIVLKRRLKKRSEDDEKFNNYSHGLMGTPYLVKKKVENAPTCKVPHYKAKVNTKSLFQQTDESKTSFSSCSTFKNTANKENYSSCPICLKSRLCDMRSYIQ